MTLHYREPGSPGEPASDQTLSDEVDGDGQVVVWPISTRNDYSSESLAVREFLPDFVHLCLARLVRVVVCDGAKKGAREFDN